MADTDPRADDDSRVNVVIANDDPIVVEGLTALVAGHPEIRVVGAAHGDPEIECTPAHFPECDVLLIDTYRRRAGGIGAASKVLAHDPPFAVAVFTDADDERLLLQALRAGVRGYLLKSTSPDDLVEDLKAIATGELVVDRRLASRAALSAARSLDIGSWPGAHLGLTRREADVLVALARGLSPREIGSSLYIGHETVRTHLRQVYRKLGVNDRAAAVAAAWREGLID